MRANNYDRVVELVSRCVGADGELHTSRGSGYYIRDGVVLTARHVLVPEGWKGIPAALDVKASPVVSTLRQQPAVAAELIWPAREALTMYEPDIALLRIPTLPELDESGSPALGFEEGLEDPTVEVHAVGFPKFKTLTRSTGKATATGKKAYDTQQINGIVKLGDSVLSGTLEIHNLQLGMSDAGKALEASLDWQGFSGAALFTLNLHLIGVVTARRPDQRFDFRAVRLQPLLDQPDFQRALGTRATIATATQATEDHGLDRLVCLVDRDPQEAAFVFAYGKCHKSSAQPELSSARPLICLLPGADLYKHVPADLAERFSVETLPKRLRWPPGTTSFWPLSWPAHYLEPADCVAQLQSQLWSQLSEAGGAPTEVAPYRAALADLTRPRLFRSDLTQLPLTAATAQSLAAWSAFWGQLRSPCSRAPAHFMMVPGTRETVHAWVQAAPMSADVVLEILPDLTMCNPNALHDWLSFKLPPLVRSVHRPFLSNLDHCLRKKFKQEFYMEDLKLHVQEITLENSRGGA